VLGHHCCVDRVRLGRALAGATVVLGVVTAAVALPGHFGPHRPVQVVATAPTNTRPPATSPVAAVGCHPPAPPVTIVVADSIDPAVLPPGFVLRQGSPTDLGRYAGVVYGRAPASGLALGPSVRLTRTRRSAPPAGAAGDGLAAVNGHPAHVYFHGYGPNSPIVDVAWAQGGTVLTVSGMGVNEREVLSVANGLRYQPGHQRVLGDANLPPFLSRREVIERVSAGEHGAVQSVDAKEMFVADFETAQSQFGQSDWGRPDQAVWLAWVTGPNLSFAHSEPAPLPGATTTPPPPANVVFGIFGQGGSSGFGAGPGPVPVAFSLLPDRQPC